MSDPFVLRAIERMVIVFGAIGFGILGYRLFIFGVKEGTARFRAESPYFKIVFSGTAPGLFFMFCGAAVLAMCLFRTTTREITRGSDALAVNQPDFAAQTPSLSLGGTLAASRHGRGEPTVRRPSSANISTEQPIRKDLAGAPQSPDQPSEIARRMLTPTPGLNGSSFGNRQWTREKLTCQGPATFSGTPIADTPVPDTR